MSNMHTLELLVRWHKGCGILVTFSHMVAISCFAACENIDWQKRRFKDRKVPLSKYGVLVLLFFVVQTLNNKAFAFDISIPLHLVFRSDLAHLGRHGGLPGSFVSVFESREDRSALAGDTFLHACAIDSGIRTRFAGYFAPCCSHTE